MAVEIALSLQWPAWRGWGRCVTAASSGALSLAAELILAIAYADLTFAEAPFRSSRGEERNCGDTGKEVESCSLHDGTLIPMQDDTAGRSEPVRLACNWQTLICYFVNKEGQPPRISKRRQEQRTEVLWTESRSWSSGFAPLFSAVAT